MAPVLLVWSVRSLALLGALSLLVSGECKQMFLAAFFIFFFLGLTLERHEKLSRALGKAQPFLAVVVLGIALLDFFALSNSFLLTVAHFLLLIQGLRLLALQTSRENLGSVLLSSLMVLSAATLSVEWTYFVFLMVFIAVLLWTLMLHTLLDESKRHAAVTAAPMALARFVPFVRTSAVVAFTITFVCCAAVFVVFPRFNFQGFRGQFLQPVRKTGFTSQVDLAGSGPIFQDNSVVMRIEVDPSQRVEWTGYIRGQALEEFHQGVWRRPPGESPTRMYRAYANDVNLLPRQHVRGPVLRQRIYLESMETSLLFAAPRAVKLVIDRPFVDVFADGAIQRISGDTWRLRYDAESSPSPLDPGRKEKFSSPSSVGGGRGRENPPQTIEALAKDITHGARSSTEKAERLTSYLQANFSYSLADGPKVQNGVDATNDFLFRTQRGHCEYFASALCLMLRSEKIPARMATGFLSQEWNDRGHYFVVRMKHAHAWVEAQMDDGTWVGFDPSPREVAGSPDLRTWRGQWSQTMDYLNLRWNRYILSYDFEKQVQVVQAMTHTSGSLSSRLGRWRRWSLSFKWGAGTSGLSAGAVPHGFAVRLPVIGTIAVSGGVLVVIFLLLRRRRASRVWFYTRLVRALERHAGQRVDKETLREFAMKHRFALAARWSAFQTLIDAYNAQRFSNGTVVVDPAAIRSTLASLKRSPSL